MLNSPVGFTGFDVPLTYPAFGIPPPGTIL
jgi:hypothetical protein